MGLRIIFDVKTLLIIVYACILMFLIFVTPLFGDPAVVYWTGRVMTITGFPYDPVCTMSPTSLCVRAPLYYSLMAISGIYYRVVLTAITVTFVILQYLLVRKLNSRLTVIGLMWPPIYLLFTRTYVDSFVALLGTLLLLVLLNTKPNDGYLTALMFLTPVLLVLTRETALAFPVFLFLLLFFSYAMNNKSRFLLILGGWVVGVFAYYVYIMVSGGFPYSDFEPHVPGLYEVYRAVMTVLSPILPWEVYVKDVASYLSFLKLPSTILSSLTIILQVLLHIFALTLILPILFAFKRFSGVNKVVKAQLFFGLFMASGLLFLKGDVDFFRHTAYLLPIVPFLVEVGVDELRKWKRYATYPVMFSYIILFILYFARTVRLFQSGYEFDPCDYLLRRPSISSIPYFYNAACEGYP